ncbi:peptide deformylase [Clostridium sp. YIM B02551]|uniref:peptide deformylase n=1 Tax=Clostridium sp. YIM B02551 TaxID=2910679 RepID=UPI001EEACDD2|nr:peptide deformylase [Clostridium sp. YIM B02551]
MAVRKIVQLGDEHLKKVCEPVKEINEEIDELIEDLRDTLATVDGVGLAAPQIAVNKRVVYIDLRDGESEPVVLINPEILEQEGKEVDSEGCLSYVGYEGLVERPTRVVVQAYDEDGNLMEYEAEGFLARCFCHEIDHLDGIMYVDKATEVYELEEEEDSEE